jgi:hypothetical protein
MSENPMKILAFSSPYPRAGKTTAAEHLAYCSDSAVSSDEIYIERMSFADPLRDMAASLFACVGLSWNQCDKDFSVVDWLNGRTPRDVLIWLGQSGREYMGENIWCRVMARRIRRTRVDVVVIDDLRMPNEYWMLRTLGAKFARVAVPDREIVPSETEARLEDDAFSFDTQIVNKMNGLPEYLEQVEAAYRTLFEGGGHECRR